MNRLAIIVACLSLAAVQPVAGQAPPPPRAGAQPAPQPSMPQLLTGGAASLQAGQHLAASGTPGGVTACVTCHGAQGEGNPAGGFPRIAGQPEFYLNKQLLAYAGNRRNNPVMSPIAKAMNAQQMRDVSAWYASLAGPAAPSPAGPAASAAAMARGRLLATVGDESERVQACANCHGPGGAGEPPNYPYLAGQHASYVTAAMGEWKSGARSTDASGQMPTIAKALNDADVAALSAFFAAQPPPPQPAGKMVNIPAGSTARPAAAPAPNAPGPPGPGSIGVQGVGTEQGAPVTGGSQGPGGGGGTQGTQPPPPPIKK